MRLFSASFGNTRFLIAAFLTLAMLCAQWAGLHHSVVHADLVQDESISAAAQHHHDDYDAEHSCTLYDAATLSCGIHSASYTPQLLPGAQVLALWAAFSSWDAPFAHHFSSRAPPRA